MKNETLNICTDCNYSIIIPGPILPYYYLSSNRNNIHINTPQTLPKPYLTPALAPVEVAVVGTLSVLSELLGPLDVFFQLVGSH